jgi:fatty acid desaturase
VASVLTRRDFTAEDRRAISELRTLDKRWNWVIVLHYAIWLSCAWVAIRLSNLVASAAAIVLGGLAMSALSVLAHEASHNLFTRKTAIDRWFGFFAGAPLLFAAAGYRVMHPLHHKYVRSEGDPDDIENITRRPGLRWVYVFLFFFGVYLYLIAVPANAIRRARGWGRFNVIAEWAVMIAIITLGWVLLPAQWMLEGWLFPLMVAGQIANIRGLAEHGMTTSGNELTDTRTVATNRVLSFLMCNINYHLEHHLYPGIPWYNLPRLHRTLYGHYVDAGSSVYRSYGRFLLDVWRAIRSGVTASHRLVPPHIRDHICV